MRSLRPWPGLALIMGLCLTLPGCLLTLGSPLVRRVEPGSWTVQAGGGVSAGVNGARPGVLSHLYVGHALGRHFEVGLLPYGYTLGDDVVPAIYVPVKWDPFPLEWPVRWILHAGPVLYLVESLTPGPVVGTGLAFEMGRSVEAYLAASTVIPYLNLTSFAGGVRVSLTDRYSLALGAVVGLPVVFGVELTASLVLGP